jgi:plastocyanin
MKTIHALAFAIGAFFSMNCGSGDDGGGYGSGSTTGSGSSSQTGQQGPSGSSGAAQPATFAAEVKVFGHDFDPPEVHVKVGQTVRWTWVSGSHNVVSGTSCTADGQFTSGQSGAAPKTFDHTFDKAGTFPYFCDPHCGIGMTGKVVVE